MSPRTLRFALVLVALISAGIYLALALHPATWRHRPWIHGGGGIVLGLLYLVGCALALQPRLDPHRVTAFVLAAGLIFRLLTLGTPDAVGIAPTDDAARYIIEGRQIAHGQNPYVLAPDHPRTLPVWRNLPRADWIARELNHPSWTAIYPPVVLGAETLLATIHPHPWTFKLWALCCEAATCALALLLLARHGRSPVLVVLLAWNPIGPLFITGEGHQDALQAALMLAGFCAAATAHPIRSLCAHALACLVKPFAVLPLGAQALRLPRRYWLIPPLIALLAYLPFADAGTGLVASFGRFGTEAHWHGALYTLLRTLLARAVPPDLLGTLAAGVALAALVTGCVVLYRAFADRGDERPLLLAGYGYAWLLACLPTLHPWYFYPLVALLPVARSWGLSLWTGIGAAYWLHACGWSDGRWGSPLGWVLLLAHLPAAAIVVGEILAARRTQERNSAHEHPPAVHLRQSPDRGAGQDPPGA